MRYEEIEPIDISEARETLASGNPTLIADALVRASLSQVDSTWVEAASLRSLERPEFDVQWAALLALGHLVRRYGYINVDEVMGGIKSLRRDPRLTGRIDDLMDDIKMFYSNEVRKR